MRIRTIAAVVALCVVISGLLTGASVTDAQGPSCANYPNQSAAQSAYRANPFGLRVLDPGGGFACPGLSCPCDQMAVQRPTDAVDPTPVLISLADLPAGWSARALTPSNGAPAFPGFAALADGGGNENGTVTVRAAFAGSEFGPFLSQSVVSVVSGLGYYIMPYLRQGFAPAEWESLDDDGLPTSNSLTLLPAFPTYGDDSFAVRWDVRGATVDLQGIIVVSRRSDLASILTVVVAGIGGARVDETQVVALARLADAKLAALSGGT